MLLECLWGRGTHYSQNHHPLALGPMELSLSPPCAAPPPAPAPPHPGQWPPSPPAGVQPGPPTRRPLPGAPSPPPSRGSRKGSSCLRGPEVVQPQLDVHLPGVQGQRAREQQDRHDRLEAAPGGGVGPSARGGGPVSAQAWSSNGGRGQRAPRRLDTPSGTRHSRVSPGPEAPPNLGGVEKPPRTFPASGQRTQPRADVATERARRGAPTPRPWCTR